jgi:hypothetical protein
VSGLGGGLERSLREEPLSRGTKTRFLKEALKAQKLEGYWTTYDADGRPKA